jgi:hypothetical protein
VINHQLGFFTVDKRSARRRLKLEFHVLHGADFVLLTMPLLKTAADGMITDIEKDHFVNAQKLKEILTQMSLILNFQKKRGAQLARIRNEFVVDRDLFSNLVKISHSFCPHHFLDLEDHRVAVFEDERDLIPDGDSSFFLLVDNGIAKLLPHLFVGRDA